MNKTMALKCESHLHQHRGYDEAPNRRLVRRTSLDCLSDYFQSGGVRRVLQKFEDGEQCGNQIDQGTNDALNLGAS